MKKKIFYLLIILFIANANAQHARVYANLSVYSHSEFKNNVFSEIGGGVEVKVHRFLKPEIGVSYFSGSIEDYSKVNEQGIILDLRTSRAYAFNINVTPKISLYSREVNSGDVFIQILPRFNAAKIGAERYYTVINQSNPSKSDTKKEVISEWQQSFGIGVGIDIVISDRSYDSFSINLYYNGVDLGKVLKEVNNYDGTLNTNTLGIGISYYLGFEKKKD
jgi:hypothetical protein